MYLYLNGLPMISVYVHSDNGFVKFLVGRLYQIVVYVFLNKYTQIWLV